MLRARDVMTTDPVCVVDRDSVEMAAHLMQDWKVGLLPVVEHPLYKRLVGVITDRDIAVRCVAAGHVPPDCQVGAHMTATGLVTAMPDTPVDTVMDRLVGAGIQRAPVIDDEEILVGVISRAEIARRATQ